MFSQTLLNELRVLCKGTSQATPTSYTHTKGELLQCKYDQLSLFLALEYANRVAVAQKQAALYAFVSRTPCTNW